MRLYICFKHILALLLFAGAVFVIAGPGQAQIKLSVTADEDTSATDEEPFEQFRVASTMHLGPNGFVSGTKFQMVDENGFAYDALSLFSNPNTKQMIGLTDDQFTEMSKIQKNRSELLKAKLPSIIAGTSDKEDLKSQFHEFEDQILKVLTPEQFDAMDQVKFQAAVQENGLAKVLGTQQMREDYGISDEDLKKIGAQLKVAKKEGQSKTALLLTQANKRLLEQLSKAQREKLESAIGKEGIERFLKSNLFTNSQQATKKPRKKYSDPLRTVRLKSLRAKLEISDSQATELEAFRKELDAPAKRDQQAVESRIGEILDERQVVELNQYVANKLCEKSGTVFGLTYGYLSELIGLEVEESEKVFKAGVEIQHDLKKEFAAIKRESAIAALGVIQSNDKGKLQKFMGKARLR